MKSYYLAPISYYAAMLRSGVRDVDVDARYVKQTLHNRCWIASPNGPLALTVPVEKHSPTAPIRDIRISEHGRWRHLHWNALTSSYRRTPFFEFYADDFAPFYEKRWDFLVDYNQALQDLVCEELGPIDNSQQPIVNSQQPIANSQQPIAEVSIPYYQLFSDRNGFMPDLSIVDLLFNMGPESILYLKKTPLQLPQGERIQNKKSPLTNNL